MRPSVGAKSEQFTMPCSYRSKSQMEAIRLSHAMRFQEYSKLASLAVSFDEYIGHDYVQNVTERYDFYHKDEAKIPFDLDKFNAITKGGLPNKTLNIALAGTGVGKSLFMCHSAAACLSQGKNVLYITCEMGRGKDCRKN